MAPKKPAAKTYKDTPGAPPSQVMQDDQLPLLAADAPLSDGAKAPKVPADTGTTKAVSPAQATTNLQRNQTAVKIVAGPEIDASSYYNSNYDDIKVDGRAICFTAVRPVCCTVLFLTAMAISYASGYLHREHQVESAAERITQLEEALGVYEVVDDLRSLNLGEAVNDVAHSGAALWFFGGPDLPTCADGLTIPGPAQSPANTMTFLSLLLWAFIGVAIGADLFMEAIEQITSEEVTHVITTQNGKKREITSKVWNATVANLTLMALGSSAPEILLSVIEITSSGFYAGELGPSTIVGSAAFNLMVISAVCVMAIPPGEGRYIKERGVFYITATFSVFAYGWLLIILMQSSPNIVTPIEGLLTLGFFGVLVQLAYWADCGYFDHITCWGGKSGATHPARRRQVELSGTGSKESAKASRAYYRINATRAVTGAAQTDVREERRINSVLKTAVLTNKGSLPALGTFEVGAASISIGDSERWAEIQVVRHGNVLPPASVDYVCRCSFTGQGEDDIAAQGRVDFGPSQQAATIRLEVLDEDRQRASSGQIFELTLSSPSPGNQLGSLNSCAVKVVRENSPGTFIIEVDHISVKEEAKKAVLTLKRIDGARGKVSCVVNTQDGKAIAPADYIPIKDMTLEFDEGVLERSVAVPIVSDSKYEGDEDFKVIFSSAEGGAKFSDECNGGPERAIAQVIIECDDNEASGPFDRLWVKLGINSDLCILIASEWSNQFDEAVRFEGELTVSAISLYLLALPWRIIFAFAPPPRLAGGWVCFFVVLAMIGILTAVIGDLASHLGCCMGIAPSITAITFVALGTSLPDTFASMNAAVNEEHADASIGNVTGSNSVNVFLGLGLPWAMAALYWTLFASGDAEVAWHSRYSAEDWYVPGMAVAFAVPAADLGFSVAGAHST